MKRSELSSALRFALLAALCAIVAVVALEPWVGHGRARALFALALLPVAGMRFAGSFGARARVSFGLGVTCFALWLAHFPWPYVALPLAGAFGVTRVLCTGRHPPAQALALEVVLLGGGLLLGALCHGWSTLSFGLSVWAFFLVQAAHALAGPADATHAPIDPFERARDQALELLDRDPR